MAETNLVLSIDNILELLNGIEMDSPVHHNNRSKKYIAEAIWAIRHAQMIMKFLRALLCYISKWNDDDKAQILPSFSTEIEAALKAAETGLSADCAEADEHQNGNKMQAIGNFHNKIVDHIQQRVIDAYDSLSRVSHLPPVSDHIVFDEFVGSVQAYLVILPPELDAYFDPQRWFHFLPITFGGRSYYREGYPEINWLSSTALEVCQAIVGKLEILKCFLRNFAQHCIDKEYLQSFLARAGALILSVAHLSCVSLYDRDSLFFPQRMFRTFSGLADKISPHNQEVTEIYLGVLEGYVETLKAAAKPSSGSVGSMTVEGDVSNSFLTFTLSAKKRVDTLYDALAFPLMDLVVTPEDCTGDRVELFLKGGIVAVARECGSLDRSICADEMSKDQVVEKKFVLSKLWQKIKLIKAEIFLLELHNHKADLMVPMKDQGSAVVAVRKAMKLLNEFFKTPEQFLEDSGNLILALIEDVLREARSFYNSYQAGSITEDVVSESSLAIFKLFKAEAILMVLIHIEASSVFLAKYRVETLHKGLIFLRALLSDPLSNKLEDRNFSTFVEAVASEATFLVCSFGGNKMDKHLDRKMHHFLSHLHRIIELNITEIKAIYHPSPWSFFSNFPKSDGFSFLGFLLGELRELLIYKPDTIAFMEDQIQALMGELEFLMSRLKDVADQLNENIDLRTRVICLIYEAEYIIDMFVTSEVPLWYHQLVLFNVIVEAKLIKAEVLQFYNERNCDYQVQNAELTLRRMSLEASTPRIDEVIVGVDDQAQAIIDQLQSGPQKLDIVSIVGIPGLGKTTLAKKVYSNVSVHYHFIIRGWCCVSQICQKRELILDILSGFVELTDIIKKLDEEDLSLTLYQKLKGKRFLIVMDDVWTIGQWNDLKSLFPDDKNGSRVLFTSRHPDVVLQANPTREPHSLRLLSGDESWMLLQDRLFHGGSCPEHLSRVGKKIARSCHGLPLAIVVVAGLLKSKVMRRDWWEELAESLRSRIIHDPNKQFMHILEMSYNHLPNYLKPCFLYLGVFLEDQDIPVQKLKILWIAEGFVPKVDLKSSEETAENYLAKLIGRSLIMEAKRRSKGGTKTCRMHDMLRDFCLEKARVENFMQLVSMHDGDDSKKHYYPSNSRTFVQYRLCVHSAKQHIMESLPFGSHVHSLLFLGTNKTEARRCYDFSSISHKFKLLRVLDLESICFSESFPSGIELMFRLRYLAIKGNMRAVPSSIAKLWNLETLIVKGTHGEVALPGSLWSMTKLRHVQVDNRATFTLPDHELENSTLLDNLATLSSPVLSDGKETEKILRRLIGLKKLRCIFLKNRDDVRECNGFPAMDFLTQLESLKIFCYDRISFPREFNFPQNLTKLTLSKFYLPWEYISAIRGLSNLEVLKLLCRAFEGQTWEMTEGEFPNLKFLKLDSLNIANWNASSDHFPKLQRLVLQSCKKLKEVPSGFGEISTLQMIEINWCNQSAAKSIGTIYEQQLDLANEDFKVLISPPEWDFRASS